MSRMRSSVTELSGHVSKLAPALGVADPYLLMQSLAGLASARVRESPSRAKRAGSSTPRSSLAASIVPAGSTPEPADEWEGWTMYDEDPGVYVAPVTHCSTVSRSSCSRVHARRSEEFRM